MLLSITWVERVRCAIGCVLVIGVGVLTPLRGGAYTVGAGAGLVSAYTPLEVMQGLESACSPLEVMQGLVQGWSLHAHPWK